ncbi:hypothetical protein [Aquimarina rubra]|uniref:Uncharacterized protein n=1 Tax=Aquimarina rubra TaxID=1920033 RepID=A0ABW5L9N5_9FLAO
MNKTKLKRTISFLLIIVGAVLLIIEIASSKKNYYAQSGGLICLMTGLFLVNSSVSSRSTETNIEYQENSIEEE